MVICRPHIILNAAMSIDGKIATVTRDSQLSSKKDMERVHKLRSSVDAILVGKNTINYDDPLLTVRLTDGKNPTRVIMDSMASISCDSRILQSCDSIPTIIAVSKKAPKNKLDLLKKLPVEIIISGEESVNPIPLVETLYRKGIKSIMVEGGGNVNWAFVKNRLFDELYVTVSPFLIGGSNAVSLVEGDGFKTIQESAKLSLESVTQLEDHIVLHYVVNSKNN